MARILVGWRQGAASIALAVAIVSAIVAYRYFHRPIFANDFSQGELDLLPTWHVAPMPLPGGGTFLVDRRLNIALVARQSNANPASSRDIAIDENGDNILITSKGKTVEIPRRPGNQLVVIGSQAADVYALPPGKAKFLEDAYWKGREDFDAELSLLTAGPAGRY